MLINGILRLLSKIEGHMLTTSLSARDQETLRLSHFAFVLTNCSPLYLPAWLLCRMEELANGGVKPYRVPLSA